MWREGKKDSATLSQNGDVHLYVTIMCSVDVYAHPAALLMVAGPYYHSTSCRLVIRAINQSVPPSHPAKLFVCCCAWSTYRAPWGAHLDHETSGGPAPSGGPLWNQIGIRPKADRRPCGSDPRRMGVHCLVPNFRILTLSGSAVVRLTQPAGGIMTTTLKAQPLGCYGAPNSALGRYNDDHAKSS